MPARAPLLLAGAALAIAVIAAAGLWLGPRSEAIPGDGPLGGPTGGGPSGGEASEAGPLPDLARAPIPIDWDEPIPMTVYFDPTCDCCSAWMEQMAAQGFKVDAQLRADMGAVKKELGVRPEHSSCHTAVVNGYLVEGHVPEDDLRRFLAEAPPVRGISVPGMPIGAPGMEAGDLVYPYEVLTFTSDGRTGVYATYGRN